MRCKEMVIAHLIADRFPDITMTRMIQTVAPGKKMVRVHYLRAAGWFKISPTVLSSRRADGQCRGRRGLETPGSDQGSGRGWAALPVSGMLRRPRNPRVCWSGASRLGGWPANPNQ